MKKAYIKPKINRIQLSTSPIMATASRPLTNEHDVWQPINPFDDDDEESEEW